MKQVPDDADEEIFKRKVHRATQKAPAPEDNNNKRGNEDQKTKESQTSTFSFFGTTQTPAPGTFGMGAGFFGSKPLTGGTSTSGFGTSSNPFLKSGVQKPNVDSKAFTEKYAGFINSSSAAPKQEKNNDEEEKDEEDDDGEDPAANKLHAETEEPSYDPSKIKSSPLDPSPYTKLVSV